MWHESRRGEEVGWQQQGSGKMKINTAGYIWKREMKFATFYDNNKKLIKYMKDTQVL